MSNLFEEADVAADTLRKRPGFVPEDLPIMFRLAQRHHHPDYTDDQFSYLFDIWHDQYPARHAAKKAAANARMLELLKAASRTCRPEERHRREARIQIIAFDVRHGGESYKDRP
jgi:hypothetical protein